ncbi:MAG: TauD/TfdA family dioxygenase [Leptolyngbya sp. SIO3F4]|nr:TauD/TfdA family dioxygenase [Leptolyngbya sp. SIO3F4]
MFTIVGSTNLRVSMPCSYEMSDIKWCISHSQVDLIRHVLSKKTSRLIEDYFDYATFASNYLPQFLALSDEVSRRLENKFRFVVIRNTPFVAYEYKICRFLFLVLASLIGIPTCTSLPGKNRKDIVWEVKPKLKISDTQIHSQSNYFVEPHTDASYKDIPDRYVALLAIHPAMNSEGTNILVDGQKLVDRLVEIDKNMHDFLTLDFPFKVPDIFCPDTNSGVKIKNFPIFQSEPFLIRYSWNYIRDGQRNITNSCHMDSSLDLFREVLKNLPQYFIHLNKGDLLILNNHEILHGRTEFSDLNRLLLRVRMQALDKSTK